MKVIETQYKGYRFRSRLEARWAVAFDALGWRWQYEPEGFEKDGWEDSASVVRYLPDFHLPDFGVWVEVKGTDEALRRDAQRLETMLDYGSPLPGFDDSFGSRRGLLILGDIPEWRDRGVAFHAFIQHKKGLALRWAALLPEVGPWPAEEGLCSDLLGIPRTSWDYPDHWTTKCIWPDGTYLPKTLKAYDAARAARFEHGETPRAA